MSVPGPLDHLLAAILVIGLPAYGAVNYRALLDALTRGEPGIRIQRYWTTIATEWTLVAVTLLIWRRAGRPWPELGLALPLGAAGLLGLAVTLLVLGFLAVQWAAILRLDSAGLERLRRQLAGAAGLMPTNEREHRVFRLLAISAGICEEIFSRGFLIWYFSTWIGPWPAVVANGVVFGIGHLYQGKAGMLKTGLAGLIAGIFYLTTRSLLWPMIAHAAIDLQGGAVGRKINRELERS